MRGRVDARDAVHRVGRCRAGATPVTICMSDRRKIIELFYEDIWNRHDHGRIAALVHERFTFRGSLGQSRQGRAGFAEYVDMVHAALGEYRCEIQDVISEGNQAFAQMKFSGIHRGEFLGYYPTQKRVEWAGAAVFTFD